MAIRADFRFEFIHGDFEHVIACGADAVNLRLVAWFSLRLSVGLRLRRLAHERILARTGARGFAGFLRGPSLQNLDDARDHIAHTHRPVEDGRRFDLDGIATRRDDHDRHSLGEQSQRCRAAAFCARLKNYRRRRLARGQSHSGLVEGFHTQGLDPSLS
jgi:hypothetical protein